MGNKGDLVILDTPDTPFAQKQKAVQYNFYSIFAKLLVPSCQGDPDCSGSQHCCQLVLAANLSMYKSVQHDYYSIRFLSLLLCYQTTICLFESLVTSVFVGQVAFVATGCITEMAQLVGCHSRLFSQNHGLFSNYIKSECQAVGEFACECARFYCLTASFVRDMACRQLFEYL